jgi:hypothetical protein
MLSHYFLDKDLFTHKKKGDETTTEQLVNFILYLISKEN